VKQPDNEKERLNKQKEQNVSDLLRREYNKLGDISFHEVGVLFVFILTVLLWLFRDPRFMPGIQYYLQWQLLICH